jgi:hypothetical protein
VTSIKAYGRGYVATGVQVLVSLLDGEDQRDFLRYYMVLWKFFNIMGSLLLPE